MADVQSNIKVSIDTTEALASIKNLQRQISAFHTSMAKSGAAANAVTGQMQQNLINSINATGKFSAQMRTIRTTTESFTNSLEKNKFSMGEYFRYAGGASKSFGKLFKTEFETINKVARENVKDLQTQYIKMGRDANGAMKSIAVRPLSLDMNNLATKTMIASEKQAILNQLLKQGSTNLLNFGKNTQWAGRQLMVGFTIPLVALGAAASKTFMDMETQAIRFKKVYGDLFTSTEETAGALDAIKNLGKEFTKYGVAVSQTVELASEAAAAGFKGLDLQRQTAAATKLSILGQVESQKALETTIALQNAFSMSSEDLATNIDFLNAVENQTVLSLDDISTAIPKAAPVIQQLGGDVKDLAFFMAAMKEGGINASEGANALKSGLASMINPTGKASAMLAGLGINIKKIVVDNKGDLKKTVIDFATALNQLDPLNRAQAIEQMFGKFQFARLSTLFANVTKEGTQASRVLDLAGSSIQDLAALSEKELGQTSESTMVKFKASIENLKLSLVPLGEQFLKIITPIAEFVTKMLDKFNNLGEGTKKIIVVVTGIVAGLGPVLLMTFGLLMNGLANIIKGFTFMKSLFNKTGQASATLGTEVKYMTTEQRNAAAVAASLDQVHKKLAQTFSSEAASVDALTRAYQRSIAAQSQFMPSGMPLGRGPIKKRAKGKPSTVGGTGNQDSELAYLMPGETVIPTDMSKKYGALINGMIADNIPGYGEGKPKAPALYNQELIDKLYEATGVDPKDKIRIPLPITSPSYSVSGIMAPKSVNTKVGGIGMDKEYLSSPIGRDALSATIQAEIEDLGISSKRVSQVLDEIAPQLDTAVNEFDDTVQGWKNSSEKAMKTIEKSPVLTEQEKRAIRRRLAPVDPTDYTVTSDPVLEIKKQGSKGGTGKGTPRDERDDKTYKTGRIKQIMKAKGHNTKDFVFAHMPGYEKIESPDRATMRPPRAGKKVLTGKALAAAEAMREKHLLNQGYSKEELAKIAKEDAKVYKAAVEEGAQDPYVAGRDRSSPHRLAGKDGKDDAVAYNKAREKEENKNNRKRRSASRKQGAPVTVIPASAADPRVIPFSDAKPQIIPQVIPPGYTPPEGPMYGPKKPNRYDKTFGKVAAKFRDPDGKFKGRGMGMGLSTVAMMGSQMIPGKTGQMVQQVGMVGFAISALQPLITGLIAVVGGLTVGIAAAILAIAAIGFAWGKATKSASDKIVDSAKKEAEARVGSARAITQFGKTFNKALPSSREFSRNNTQGIKASGTRESEFAKDYATKGNISAQIINQAALGGAESGINAIALDVANKAAVLGLSPDDIAANIKAASKLIDADQIKVKLAVQKLLSPDGKDILKEPLSIKARMEFLNNQSQPQIKALEEQITNLGSLDLGHIQGTKTPDGLAQKFNFTYKGLKEAAGKQQSINDAYAEGWWGNVKGVAQQVWRETYDGSTIDHLLTTRSVDDAIQNMNETLPQTIDVVKQFASVEAEIQASSTVLSISFMQQTEALALLNAQYADGLITKESYDEQLKVSQANFSALGKSSGNLVKQLNKIDPSGTLAAAAVKDLGDQALATLKAANPALFDKLAKSFEGLSNWAQIDIYMGYANGSLTITDLALLPSILKQIDGQTATVALKIIEDSELSPRAKAGNKIKIERQGLKKAEEKLAKLKAISAEAERLRKLGMPQVGSTDPIMQNYRENTAQMEIDAYKARLKALYAERDDTGVNPVGDLDTDDVNDYKDITDGKDGAKTATEKYLEVLQKEIDALKAKRDAQKDANDEVQREIDLKMKLQDLANQAVEAKISGNYIKAAMLTQEAKNVQMKYNQETELRKKDAEIARLEARYNAIEGGAKLTKAETAKIPKYASGGKITGPGTSKSDSIPAYLSNGEYVIQASSVKKYGVDHFDALNAQRFAIGSPGGVSPTPRPAKTNVPMGQIWGWERQWQEANKQVVKIPVPPITANFATNSFLLNKEQRLELQKIAKQLIEAQVKAIIVQGHTDSVGSGKDNKILSQNRANAIAEYISKFVPGTGFVPVGYGEYKPLVPNTTAENRAKNRRAELILPDKYKTTYPEFKPENHRWVINTGKIEGGGSIQGGGTMVDSFKPLPKTKKTEAPKKMLVRGFAEGGMVMPHGVSKTLKDFSGPHGNKDIFSSSIIGHGGTWETPEQVDAYNKFVKDTIFEMTGFPSAKRIVTGNSENILLDMLGSIPLVGGIFKSGKTIAKMPKMLKDLKILKGSTHNSHDPNLNNKVLDPLKHVSAKQDTLNRGNYLATSDPLEFASNWYKLSLSSLVKGSSRKGLITEEKWREVFGAGKFYPSMVETSSPEYYAYLKSGYTGIIDSTHNQVALKYPVKYKTADPKDFIKTENGYHDGGPVHPHPHDALTNTLIQAPRKGTTAYAKYAYEMAKRGGAAKTAAKLTKPIKTDAGPAYEFLQDGAVGYSRARKYTYEDAGMGSAKEVESKILSDLSKTAMRAKIIEMNGKFAEGGLFDISQVKYNPGPDEQVGTGFFKIDADGNEVEITSSHNERKAKGKANNVAARAALASRRAARAKALEYAKILEAIDGANPLSSRAFKAAPGLASGDKSPLMFANGGLANYRLPSYEVGSSYIPKDQIAQLHKGERVLTAEENKNFTASGPVTNIININGSDLNKKEIATAVMVELDRAQKKNNKTNMVNN